MKKFPLLIFVLSINLITAQVGIGTTTPTADLQVVGDVLVQDSFKTGSLGTVSGAEEGFKLLTRNTSSNPVGEITVLDVDQLNVAPVNVVDYHFTNIHLDNLSDVNLQYDSNKYVVGVANFRQTGDAVKKTTVSGNKSIGTFVVRTFASSGTWHLEIQNRDLDLDAGDSLEYYVTLIVYNKSYFRNMPSINTNLGGSNTGIASSVPDLY
ncbi:hypothetical protein [Ulvibacter sp. MAR_2010_11]|uniref:hypothetical protein n=1 Tax=Ulvibacter sp. MAR_2010_11 TaxID=1250229 RepID=UPI000C2C9E80|nr:hypothetical protein [Ulvibacter sp. MAR_2010_11]